MLPKSLTKTQKAVYPIIESYLKDPEYPKQFDITNKFSEEVNLFWNINRDYPERKGKYIRPTLVRLVASALGADTQKTNKVAAAMQLSEEWILISDDIEDNSETRRGKPTLHKMYGVELAVNASDTLETIMWKMIIDCKNDKIIDEFYRMLLRTTLGQAVEQIWTNKKTKLTDKQYFFVTDSKSAYYSIAGPMRLGAIVAGATAKQLDKITNFGYHLGRCFQLIDDILDYEQDKKEGKTTLANTKGIEYTKKLAVSEKDLARDILEKDLKFLNNQPARDELFELANFILEREY